MKRSSSEPGLRWRPRKFTCRLKRIPNLLRCFYLHSPCLTINITFKNLYEIFKRWIDFLVAKLKDRLFGGFRPPCATQRKHQHGVSIQSFIDLGKTNILRLNNRSDLILGEAFLIFISFHFPDSGRYALNSFDFYFWWRDSENRQQRQKTRRPPKKRVPWLFARAHKAFRHMRLCGVFWLSQRRVSLSFPRYKGYMSSTDLKNSPRAFA